VLRRGEFKTFVFFLFYFSLFLNFINIFDQLWISKKLQDTKPNFIIYVKGFILQQEIKITFHFIRIFCCSLFVGFERKRGERDVKVSEIMCVRERDGK